MKKGYVILILVLTILLTALFCYHSFGWFRGDTLAYLKTNCMPNGNEIVTGEHLATGEDEEGGYLIYRVTTEDGASHHVRVNVTFHRYLTKIGPDFKIREVFEIPSYDEIMKEP